ncbi:hypothetical protein ONZ45_g7335 [Pleurotus djamor]|nr:hypothetical protein ONZ45_g7335 [Pleurotus djamor]
MQYELKLEVPSSPVSPTYDPLPLSPGRIPRSLVDLAAHSGIKEHLASAFEASTGLWDVSNPRNPGVIEFPRSESSCTKYSDNIGLHNATPWRGLRDTPVTRRHTIDHIPSSSATLSGSTKRWRHFVPILKKSPNAQTTHRSQSAPSSPTRSRRLSLASLAKWSPTRKASRSPLDDSSGDEPARAPPSRRDRKLSLASIRRWTSPSRSHSYAAPSLSAPPPAAHVAVEVPIESLDLVPSNERTEFLGESPIVDELDSEDDEESDVDSDDSEDTLIDLLPPFSPKSSTKLRQIDEDDEIGAFFISQNTVDMSMPSDDVDAEATEVKIHSPDDDEEFNLWFDCCENFSDEDKTAIEAALPVIEPSALDEDELPLDPKVFSLLKDIFDSQPSWIDKAPALETWLSESKSKVHYPPPPVHPSLSPHRYLNPPSHRKAIRRIDSKDLIQYSRSNLFIFALSWPFMTFISYATASTDADSSGQPSARGRGRGKSRGGLGKHLRARGGRRGGGRPAEFGKRLLLEGEGPPDEEDEEAAKELEKKFSRRQLGSNADRYKEEEPELDSDGKLHLREPIVEPEVDLSGFLERQKQSDDTKVTIPGAETNLQEDEDDEVDHSLAQLMSSKGNLSASKKGRVSNIDWDDGLADMRKEKEAVDAARDLKARFQMKAEHIRMRPVMPSKKDAFVLPPPLPPTDGSKPAEKDSKKEMEAFLDELLD